MTLPKKSNTKKKSFQKKEKNEKNELTIETTIKQPNTKKSKLENTQTHTNP